MSVAISLFVGLILGGAGTAAGWFVKRYLENRGQNSSSAGGSSEELGLLSLKRQEVESFLAKLRETAEHLAYDVEEHTESMQEANVKLQMEELNASDAVITVLNQVLVANSKLQTQLESAEDKLFDQARQIQSHVLEANTDALTLVSNRRAFDTEMAVADERYSTDGKPVSVMMLDVDHFKKLNDSFGHLAGDEVLKSVARTLRRKVKRNGLVCRYGGEEFAVIFHGKSVDQCMTWAEQARAELGRTRVSFEGDTLQATASSGLAEISDFGGAEGMIKRADDALYDAKEGGRNCGFWNDGTKNYRIPALESHQVAEPQEHAEEPTWAVDLTDSRNFHDELGRRLAEWKRGGSCLSLGVLKVDNWIDLYTSQGEQTADLVLKATAQFLKASVRDMDNVAILGEGQFAMLFPSARLENTVKIGERLRSAISRCEVPSEGGKLNFTVSVGIAEAMVVDSAADFFGRAQGAMGIAVSQGGNLCFAHDGDREVRVTKREIPVGERKR